MKLSKTHLLALIMFSAALPIRAQSIDIPVIGTIKIGGKLGKLLRGSNPDKAASSPAEQESAAKESQNAASSGAKSIERPQGSRKITYPATLAEALTCNSVLDLGNIARLNDPSDPRRSIFINPNKDERIPLWTLIVTSSPELRNLPNDEAYNRMYVIRDKHTSDVQGKYLGDINLLVSDYKECQRKGLIP